MISSCRSSSIDTLQYSTDVHWTQIPTTSRILFTRHHSSRCGATSILSQNLTEMESSVRVLKINYTGVISEPISTLAIKRTCTNQALFPQVFTVLINLFSFGCIKLFFFHIKQKMLPGLWYYPFFFFFLTVVISSFANIITEQSDAIKSFLQIQIQGTSIVHGTEPFKQSHSCRHFSLKTFKDTKTYLNAIFKNVGRHRDSCKS